MSVITWDSAQSTLDGMGVSEYLIGFTDQGKPVTFHMDGDASNVHVMTSSGGGASSLLRLFARQMNGRSDVADIHVIGPTRITGRFIGMEKVIESRGSLETTPEVINGHHERMVSTFADVWEAMMILNRRVLLIDRVDVLFRRLGSPEREKLIELASLGRAAGVHLIVTSNGPAGMDPAFRAQFGTQIVARVTANTWRELNTADPMPEEIRTGQRGMFAVIRNGGTIVTRAVYSD